MLFLLICSLTVFIYGCGSSSSSENISSSEVLVTPRPFLENSNIESTEVTQKEQDKSPEEISSNNIAIKTISSGNISENNFIAISEEDNEGFLALININNKMYFLIHNKPLNMMALIEYNLKLLNPRENSNEKKPLEFNLIVLKDNPNNKDKLLGYWEDTAHIIPIHVYTKIENNKLIPLGIFSYKGKEPQEYKEYLYEQQNVDLINTFIIHTDSLNKYIKDNNISLKNN